MSGNDVWNPQHRRALLIKKDHVKLEENYPKESKDGRLQLALM